MNESYTVVTCAAISPIVERKLEAIYEELEKECHILCYHERIYRESAADKKALPFWRLKRMCELSPDGEIYITASEMDYLK